MYNIRVQIAGQNASFFEHGFHKFCFILLLVFGFVLVTLISVNQTLASKFKKSKKSKSNLSIYLCDSKPDMQVE